MIVEKVTSSEDFERLRGEWNELVHASTANCVFLTHEWLFTWWKHLAENRGLRILTVRDQGRLVAIAPLTLKEPQYSRMMPHLLEFLGSGIIGSDYLDVIIRRGCETPALSHLARELTESGQMLQLSQLRRGNCVALTLASDLEKRNWNVADTKLNICPFINLTGHTWGSYLATLSSSQRYNLQRRLKNLSKNFDMRFECARSAGDALKALDTLIALHRKRWQSAGGVSEAFQTQAVVEFHREFVRLAAERGWLRLFTLTLNDTPVAGLYGLRYGPTFSFYQSGFDPAYARQSVGLVMMGLAIKAAVAEGSLEYDLLHGDEEYKFHWARETRELGRLELYPPRASGVIYRHAIDLNRTARKVARRVLTRTSENGAQS